MRIKVKRIKSKKTITITCYKTGTITFQAEDKELRLIEETTFTDITAIYNKMEIQSDIESHISPTQNIVPTTALLPIPKTMNSNTIVPDFELSDDDETHDPYHLARRQPNSTTVQQQIPTTEQLVIETTQLPAPEKTKNYPIQHEVSNGEQP